MQANLLPDAAKKALTESLRVEATHPDAWGPHEVAVVSGDATYFVNITVGFCTCLADHYSEMPCKHRFAFMYWSGELNIPDWVDNRVLSACIRRVCTPQHPRP